MTTIYCLGGVSGSGKTYLRQTDPFLSQMDWFDIADIYADNPGINWRGALAQIKEQVVEWLEDYDNQGISSVGVEAFFRPGSAQRRDMEALASRYDDVYIHYIWRAAPREQCYNRVLQDYYNDPCRQHSVRLKLIKKAYWEWFEPRPSEEWQPAPTRRKRSRRRNRNRNRSSYMELEYY